MKHLKLECGNMNILRPPMLFKYLLFPIDWGHDRTIFIYISVREDHKIENLVDILAKCPLRCNSQYNTFSILLASFSPIIEFQ